MTGKGMNMERVKKQNRSLILGYINDNGPLSRKDIAAATGLTPASVTQITTQLIDDGLLKELGAVRDEKRSVGRKKILIDIDPAHSYVLTANIESRETVLAVCDIKGQPVISAEDGKPLVKAVPTDREASPEEFLQRIFSDLKSLADRMPEGAKDRAACVSVGITGIVDTANGISVHAYGVWNRPVDIRSAASGVFELPVFVENNVDALAQAEILFGLGRRTGNLLLIKWGPGVGSAIILDGAIYKGSRGKAAELGHYIVKKDGDLCSCGRRGCLETEVSYYTLSKHLDFEPDSFGSSYEAADEETRAYIDSAIDLFARCVVNSGTIIAPSHIVLAGRLFSSSIIRSRLIDACRSYDSSCDPEFILHSPLAARDGFVGPAAVYVQKLLG